MAEKHRVSFYPVGNGDTTQIVLSNGRRILLDFCHRPDAEDPKTPEIDLKARLKDELRKASRDDFDVVGFTHADLDHIQGSTDFFELRYAVAYQGKDRIKIKELWVPAAMLLEETSRDEQSEEFCILRQEARHRLLEGRGIRVFSRPKLLIDWLHEKLRERGEPLTARDHLFVDAGQLVPGFTLAADGVEFFCHSPFIKHCADGDIIRNVAALVFNVRFRADGAFYDFLAVGDADWSVLEDIVLTTRAHKNEDRLNWDLYNIPHHCSYTGLSDEKGDDETTPKPLVKDLLLHGRSDAYIVSCSCPIPALKECYSQIQPPHIQARKAYQRYFKEVGGRKFLVTMEEPNAYHPEPIEFEITVGGISWAKSVLVGAPALVGSRPPRAGR
jgi:hypothetical protein